MDFENTFCSSPWIHMRIANNGDFGACRWANRMHIAKERYNIKEVSPREYFQKHMSQVRHKLLQGYKPEFCSDCYQMDRHEKVSGRARQLLKVGIQVNNFARTMRSSTFFREFRNSADDQGFTSLMPVDWQIDLGNYCNSACVMCSPESSSKLAVEFLRLGLIKQLPKSSWCDDKTSMNNFVQGLIDTPNLRYLHFIGGETLITPAFKKILRQLIHNGITEPTIGFTTNLTVWDEEAISLLSKFQKINIGMSVESLSPINDYVRYPSDISEIKKILDKWVQLGKAKNWLLQLRVTPTAFTIDSLYTVFDYAMTNEVTVESCNFLDHPRFLRINILPYELKHSAQEKIRSWIDKNLEHLIDDKIINTRNSSTVKSQILQDAQSYLSYLQNEPEDASFRRELVDFLKLIEKSRGNRILDYLPHYEKFLRSIGYQH